MSDIGDLEPCIASSLEENDLFDTAIDTLVEVTTSPESYRYTIHNIYYILYVDMDSKINQINYDIKMCTDHCKFLESYVYLWDY